MNRHAIPSSLIVFALLGAATFLPAHAGGTINKCTDGAGRVTLTDQPCDARTVRSSVAVPGTPDSDALPEYAPQGSARGASPVRPARWLPAAAPHAPLAGDMATLKQARIQMMLQDAAPRAQLASLDR